MSRFPIKDFTRKLDHILWHSRARYPFEEFVFVPHLVIIAKRRGEQSLSPRLNR